MLKKILIVDDNADIRELLRLSLDFEDYQIFEAGDADHALQLIQEIHPDLVILDVMMPGTMDGFALCGTIKSSYQINTPYVILLTARGQASDKQKGDAAGADGYLVKPFSPRLLKEYISKCF
jgi:DNA-binding response OmpR family regulator